MGYWYCFFDECNSRNEREEIAESLKSTGNFDECSLDIENPSGPGIVFFNEYNQQLCELVRDVSLGGRERVLAIAFSNDALTDSCIWRLLNAGASDLFIWDSSSYLTEIEARFDRWGEVDGILESPLICNNLVGKSLAWRSVLRDIIEVAHFTDASVLITGESGTGKELVARLIHTLDPRQDKGKIVVLDCTTIVPELSGSEFFGHERGAFTHAIASRDGAFALANGGTLFLDEVGELPLGLQAQLLRVVQEHTYKRVGGNTWQKTDFRLVCATNKDLLKEIKLGRFRHDLYYRIAGWRCHLPALCERPEDILPLAHHFLKKTWSGEKPPELDKSVCDYLIRREYSGNVRELEQLISRINYFHAGSGPITVGDIPKEERIPTASEAPEWRDENFERCINLALSLGVGLKEIGRAAEEVAIRIAVYKENTLKGAAAILRVTERTIQNHRRKSLQV